MVAVSNNPTPKDLDNNNADTYLNVLRLTSNTAQQAQNGITLIEGETDVVSTDSINYLTVGPVTPNGTETVPMDENGEYRYVMVYNWSAPGARLNELEIYIDQTVTEATVRTLDELQTALANEDIETITVAEDITSDATIAISRTNPVLYVYLFDKGRGR